MITIPHGGSDISDGTPPDHAADRPRPKRFLPKRNCFLTGREISYRPRNGRMKFLVKRLRLLRLKNYGTIEIKHRTRLGGRTSANLAFPAGGIRRPHPRLIIWGRGCGNAWSLCDIHPPHTPPDGIELLSLKT